MCLDVCLHKCFLEQPKHWTHTFIYLFFFKYLFHSSLIWCKQIKRWCNDTQPGNYNRYGIFHLCLFFVFYQAPPQLVMLNIIGRTRVGSWMDLCCTYKWCQVKQRQIFISVGQACFRLICHPLKVTHTWTVRIKISPSDFLELNQNCSN